MDEEIHYFKSKCVFFNFVPKLLICCFVEHLLHALKPLYHFFVESHGPLMMNLILHPTYLTLCEVFHQIGTKISFAKKSWTAPFLYTLRFHLPGDTKKYK